MAGGPLSPILNSTFSHSNAPMPADGGSAQPDQGEADQDAGGSSRVSQWSCHSLNMGGLGQEWWEMSRADAGDRMIRARRI